MLISQKIKRNISETTSIKLPIVGQSRMSGDQQEIDRFIDDQTNLSINAVDDGEKFLYKQRLGTAYRFAFYNAFTQDYNISLVEEGFSQDQISGGSEAIQNSFFIAQYYDSFDLDNQTLLHSSYFNGYRFYREGESTDYGIDVIEQTEFANIYLSENFINQQVDDEFDIYVRYYFFNSKTGDVIPFLAEENETLKTSERLFYTVTVNKAQRNFEVNAATPVVAKEIISVSYKQKISDDVEKLPRERQNPPAGQAFTPDGNYIELD